MVGSRTWTAMVGLVASLVVSVGLWFVFDTLLVFLFLPFVPFLFRGGGVLLDSGQSSAKACRVCGYRTTGHDHEYCPRDGHLLE